MIIPIPLEYLSKVWPEARACLDNFYEGHGFKTVDDILDEILEGSIALLMWKEEVDTKPLYFTAHKIDYPSGQTGIQVTNFGSDGLDISNYKDYADWQRTVTREIEEVAKSLGFDVMLIASRPSNIKALRDYTKQTTIIFKRLKDKQPSSIVNTEDKRLKIQIIALPRSATQSVCKWLNDSGYHFHHEHFTSGATEWPLSGMVIETNPLKARSDADRTIIISRDIVDCVKSATEAFSKGRGSFLAAAWDELRARKKKLDSLDGEVIQFDNLPEGITGFDLIGSMPYLDKPLANVDLPVDPSNITIERTFNAELVISVMGEMWDSISEDNAPNYYPDMYDEVWLKATKKGEVICLYRLNKLFGECFEVHIFCRYAYRKQAVKSTARFYEYLLVNLPYIQKIQAGIPVIYPKVIAFSKRVGFEIEGLHKSCFRKNTNLVDIQILGLTKHNLKRFLCQQQ